MVFVGSPQSADLKWSTQGQSPRFLKDRLVVGREAQRTDEV